MPDAPGARELAALAERLRALRLARGLTQWALAERGLSYKYYQRIESGRANATIRTLVRVARALGVPFPALFGADVGAGGGAGASRGAARPAAGERRRVGEARGSRRRARGERAGDRRGRSRSARR